MVVGWRIGFSASAGVGAALVLCVAVRGAMVAAAADVQWGPTWQPAYGRGDAPPRSQIEAETTAARRRARRLRVGRARLEQREIERSAVTAAALLAGRRKLADHLAAVGAVRAASELRRRLITEYPGRIDLAVEQLKGMLVKADRRRHGDLIEYASSRLIAMNEAGALPDAHDAVIRGWQARAYLRLSQARLLEAQEALAALSRAVPDDPHVLVNRAWLLLQAGRVRDARVQLEAARRGTIPNAPIAQVANHVAARLGRPDRRPVFPRRMGLEYKWELLAARPLEGQVGLADAMLAFIMADDLAGQAASGLIELNPDHNVSVWTAMQHYFRRQTPQSMRQWRRCQQDKARAALAAGKTADAVALFRRYPYAAAVHEKLLAWGGDMLRRGRSGLAFRAFRDVLACSAAGPTRAKARAGLWMALAQDAASPDARDALQAAFKGIRPDAVYPWMGGRQPAGRIRERLLASLDAPGEPPPQPPAAMEQRLLTGLPRGRAWTASQLYKLAPPILADMWYLHGQLIQGERPEDLLVVGSSLLARIDPVALRPAWARFPRILPRMPGRYGGLIYPPSPVRPGVADGKIYCRWRLDRDGEYHVSLAAFDAATGEMLWSTATDPTWENLVPTSDPVAADGRVYAMARMQGIGRTGALMFLVCQDAADGRSLWKRHIGNFNAGFGGGTYYQNSTVDLTRYGSAVTVRRGAVYCSTSMGFVARCDARDGMLEWALAYQTCRGADVRTLAARQATPPMVVGGRVIFAPRDTGGVFATDARTGRPTWDSPFAPSDEVIGVFAGTLLTADRNSIAAVDVDSGKLRWLHSLDARRVGKAVLRGESIYVACDDGIRRISAADGIAQGRTGWTGGPMYDFALRDDTIVGIGASSVQARPDKIVSAAAAPAKAPMRLPLAKNWWITRSNAELLLPPPEAKLDDRFFVLAESALECFALGGGDKLLWRRYVRPDFRPVWTAKTLLAVYEKSVVAYDGLTGDVRWRHGADLKIGHASVFGEFVILAELRLGRQVVEAIDLATGNTVWRRDFAVHMGTGEFPHDSIGWDGANLHVIVYPGRTGKAHDIVCRATDGKIVAKRPIPTPAANYRSKSQTAECGDGVMVYLGADGKLYRYRFVAGLAVAYKVSPGGSGPAQIDIVGNWVRVRRGPRNNPSSYRCDYLRLDDLDYLYTHAKPAALVGDRLYEIAGRTLSVFALRPAGRLLAKYEVPSVVGGRQSLLATISFHPAGDRMLTLSHFLPTAWDQLWKGTRTLSTLRIDAFDPASARHLGGQTLDRPYLPPGPQNQARPATRAAWRDGAVLVTGPAGLHVYRTSGDEDDEMVQPIRIVYPRAGPIKIDGVLDDWDDDSLVSPTGRAVAGATLRLAHDGARVYLAASYPDDSTIARRGARDYGGGDHLELRIIGHYVHGHLFISRDDNGRTRVENENYGGLGRVQTSDVRAAVRHDVARGRIIYEVAMLKLRQMNFSATVWDDRPATGPVPVLRFGRGLMGRDPLPGMYARIHYASASAAHERVCLEICTDSPALPESLAYRWRYSQARAPDAARRRKHYTELIKAHAKGPLAVRMLIMLDLALRTSVNARPSATVLKIAAKAGVPQAVRRQYGQAANSYLSQWVYVYGAEIKGRWPATVRFSVDLNDGRRWGHRTSWRWENSVDRIWHLNEPGSLVGRVFHSDRWVEMRVPLMWLKMQDRPIHGIRFRASSTEHVIFDRTAVVRDGKEYVIVDDAFPKGTVTGKVKWLTLPAKTGTGAHTSAFGAPSGDYTVMFDKPIARHLVPGLQAAPKIDRARTIASLRKNIPKLDGTSDGWRFFNALLRIEAGTDANKTIELYKWYLKTSPRSPQTGSALRRLFRQYQALAEADANGDRPAADPLAAIEAAIAECNVKPRVAYDFRSNDAYFGRMFVRDWLAVGPFFRGDINASAVWPPEKDAADLERQYEGLHGKVGWKPIKAQPKTGRVALDEVFAANVPTTAYAACWVHAGKPTPVVIEFGMAHVATVWLDRDIIFSKAIWDWPRPGMLRRKTTLHAGWNEILVKVSRRKRFWGFWLELIAPSGRGMPKGLTFSTTPKQPDDPPPAGLRPVGASAAQADRAGRKSK